MENTKGKVVVITGASSGIGEATAQELASKGAKLVLAARREDRLQALVQRIQDNGGEAVYHLTDVTSQEQMEELASFTQNQFGQIDVLVNNAGIMPQSLMDKKKVEEWDAMVDINIKGVMYGIAAFLPYMRERSEGHIINLSSVAGHEIRPGSAVYSATKFAVWAMTDGLRQEEVAAGSNIRTTIISPGAIATELTEKITDQDMKAGIEEFTSKVAIGSDSIARAIAYAIDEPSEVSVSEVIVRPSQQQL